MSPRIRGFLSVARLVLLPACGDATVINRLATGFQPGEDLLAIDDRLGTGEPLGLSGGDRLRGRARRNRVRSRAAARSGTAVVLGATGRRPSRRRGRA
jgi:hypothetical protein